MWGAQPRVGAGDGQVRLWLEGHGSEQRGNRAGALLAGRLSIGPSGGGFSRAPLTPPRLITDIQFMPLSQNRGQGRRVISTNWCLVHYWH